METVTDYFLESKITADGDWSHGIKRHLVLRRKVMTNIDIVLKSRHPFANKDPYSQSFGFSSSLVWMWELDNKEGWVPKNWCLWTVVLEKTLESPLNCKKIKPDNSKGNQPWILIGRNNAEAETPILWPPDAKSWLTGKDHDAGKDWRQEEKGMTKDEMVGWHHRLDGHEFEQTLGDDEGQGSLAWCSTWGCKELDTTELDHRKSKRVPEKHLLLLYWLCQSLWLCGSQWTVENSERDGNLRPPDLPLQKPACRSGSNS